MSKPELVDIGDPSLELLRLAALKARLLYEKSIVALVARTGEDPVKIEDGIISVLDLAKLIGLDTDINLDTNLEESN